MPIKACRHVKKMRGGAQAHLLEADDGGFYVVKFQNNPQHRRVLVNELVCSSFLRYLEVSSPAWTLIQITEEFLRQNPEVSLELGTQSVPVVAGRHFGSRFPGDPARLAVYDFLPDVLLNQVTNLADYLGALVFDKWVGNADARQSIFFRARLHDWAPAAGQPAKMGFVALMIDHGFAFNGPHWDFPDSPVQGLYSRRLVYERVRALDDFQPWLDRVTGFPEEEVDRAFKQIPPEWLEGEEEALERLLEQLLRRRKRVADLVSDCRKAKTNPFPRWT